MLRYKPISDYGVIGDMQSAALVGADGSIDWACLPYFDSPAVFLRLLDEQRGGYCAVHVENLVSSSRHYLDATNILETTFTTTSGSLILTDFMPVRKEGQGEGRSGNVTSDHRIVRLVRCTAGSVDFTFDVKPTFGFASETARLHSPAPGILLFTGRTIGLHVQGVEMTALADGLALAKVRACAGQVTFMALSCWEANGRIDALDLGWALSALEETRQYWTDWSGHLRYQGEYRDEIVRSTLILKLLTFRPTAAIVAAPTTSLPEVIGGKRNWDYRFSWLRDSQFALTALMRCGYAEEAHGYFHFLKEAARGQVDDLQILYSIHGKWAGSETEMSSLEGYRQSKPVRVGNAASRQKQSDVYGELLNCMFLYCRMESRGAARGTRVAEIWPLAMSLANYVAQHWKEPDHGIWESRAAPRQFVHSKAMCWAALDRAIKLASIADATAEIHRWRSERDRILDSLVAHGFNTEIGAFVQYYGADVLDASILRLPLLGVIDANNRRMVSTTEQVERRLLRNGLLDRYTDTDNQIPEGAFTSCTLWLISNYVLLGRLRQARESLEHLLSLQSPMGLFAEEINPKTGEQLGNFPQALTHASIINAICHLEGAGSCDAKIDKHDAQRSQEISPMTGVRRPIPQG